MRRGAEQRIRKFLANTFKNDGPSSVTNGDAVKGTTSFLVRLSNLDGPLSGDCCGINIAFFNTTSKVFVGKSFRTEVGDLPIAFHANPLTTSIVIESIRVDQDTGDESVSCWWHAPLEGFLKSTSLRLYKGCGQQMYLDPSVWPPPSLGATLFFEVTAPTDNSLLPTLIPPMVCVKEDYADLSAAAPQPFRLVASQLKIQEEMLAGATSMFEEAGHWSALLFAHNTHMLLSAVTEISLTIDREGSLVSSKEFNFASLSPHEGTHLVCCLRFKKAQEARFRAVCFTCFDVITGIPSFSDVDVNVTQLPFLKGPFSCEDPRCLSLEHKQPYALVPLTMGIRLSYHYTPIPAPVWIEELEPVPAPSTVTGTERKTKKERDGSKSSSKEGSVCEKSVSKEEVAAPKTPSLAPQGPAIETKGGITSADGIDIYKLLCDIMDEVKSIKAAQNRPREHVDPVDSPETALASMTAMEEKSAKIQELQPRPIALPRARQAAIAEDMRPFINPQTQERVVESAVISASGALPHDQLIVRFEGVTFGTHGAPMPPTVAIVASFSALPTQYMGPMFTRKVSNSDANYGPSYQLASGDKTQGSGFMWFEPLASATNPALKETRMTTNVYFHLYDATTMFYMASAIFKPSKITRSANSIMASKNFDLILYEDLSMTERDIPDTVPLIASTDVGFLHVTAAMLGVPTPVSPEKGVVGSVAAGDAENAKPLSGNHGKVVYVKKLPADFGAECRTENNGNRDDGQEEKRTLGCEGMTEQRASLHRLRVNFVRNLLHNPDINALAVHVNGGKIPTEHEHKLRYVEKRRDEVKSTKIAEALRARITTRHTVTAWLGAPRVASTLFTNPFPVQNTFQIEIPSTSESLSLHPETPSIMSLGPHEAVNIKTVIRIGRAHCDGPPFHTQMIVRTLQQEISRVIDFEVSTVMPVIARRYEIFGSPNEVVTKRVHARAFPSTPNVSALGAMCHFCGVVGDSCEAETRAVVEPLTPAVVAAWEEVIVKATIPSEGSRKISIVLYNNAELTECWEMWEVTLTAVQKFHTQEVFYGQTSTLTLPILCERSFASDLNVTTITHRDCIVLKVRPMKEGSSTFHVQAVQGGSMERIVVTVPCVLPRPSFEDCIDIPFSQSGSPIHRLLTFSNREVRQKKFHVSTNYMTNISVSPAHFALAPLEMKQLAITISGLNFLGTEGKWPMWIFINDDDDLTVDSYRIVVTVREGNPAIMPMF